MTNLGRRNTDQRHYPERRRSADRRQGPDLWVRLVPWAVFFTWLLAVLALMILAFAAPEDTTFFDRYYNLYRNRGWHQGFLVWAYGLIWAAAVITGLGLILNLRRNRRKTDELRWSLVLGFVFAVIGLAVFAWQGWP